MNIGMPPGGNTTVSAGTPVLAENARLKFILGTTSGTNSGKGFLRAKVTSP